MLAVLLRYFRIPLLIIVPYIFFVFIVGWFLKLSHYSFINSNREYALLFNNEIKTIFQQPLEIFAYKFYQFIGKIFPQGVSDEYNNLIFLISKNLILNISLSYIIYCAGTIGIVSILLRFETFQNVIVKLFSAKTNHQKISEINNRMNDKSGDYFRTFVHEKDRNKSSMELKLLLTDFYAFKTLQFSVIFALSFLITPFITYKIVFFFGKLILVPCLIFGVKAYLIMLQFFVILEFIGLSLLFAMFLNLFFLKYNFFVYALKNIIVENLVYLYNMDTNDNSAKEHANIRLYTFQNDFLTTLFKEKTQA